METSPGTATEAGRTRRVEMILRQIDALPTLPVVAMRLIAVTTSNDSDARQVVELVQQDLSMTTRLLALCRRSSVGLREQNLTLDRAVVLLGFNAVRNVVLSAKLLEHFMPAAHAEPAPDDQPTLNRTEFWRHSLAVGVACELIAAAHKDSAISSGEAFVCGLLHDVGKLALDYVLPKSYSRVLELVELNQAGISEFERRIVGIDHHAAGRRLAEQWNLPPRIRDCIWLHGTPPSLLPSVEHRRLIGLVGLADLVARQQHIGYSGNFSLRQDPAELIEALKLDHRLVERAVAGLHEEVRRRSELIGLDDKPSHELYLQSIERANTMLGRLNSALQRRARLATRQSRILDAITQFHRRNKPNHSVEEVLCDVVRSATEVIGRGNYATLCQPLPDQSWQVLQHGSDGKVVQSQMTPPPVGVPNLVTIDTSQPAPMSLLGVVPWLAGELVRFEDPQKVQLLPLGCGFGASAVLLHDVSTPQSWSDLLPLTNTWGAAVAAATRCEQASRLGDELATLNRAMSDMQEELLRTQTMARLGQMAAGAAHEMNNPLAVICGRSQLLKQALPAGSEEQKAAEQLVEQSHRLSNLITALSDLAETPKPRRKPSQIASIIDDAVKKVRSEAGHSKHRPIDLQIQGDLPQASLDPNQISVVLRELISNALQANPRTAVFVSIRHDAAERRLIVQVSDDGVGMDSHTLEHAFDPFFSVKAAGRRIGMGLTRARQLAVAHGGNIQLRSAVGEGTVATLSLPLDSTS